jgi:hypothetical protein
MIPSKDNNWGVPYYDPESWYGGFPLNGNFNDNSPGNFLPKEFQVKATISDLLSTIKSKKPIAKEKTSEDLQWCVWTEGDGKPSYWHSNHGVNWWSDLEYDCCNKDIKPKWRHKESKGKLMSTGKHGLGINYAVACNLWGKELVDNLPEIKT